MGPSNTFAGGRVMTALNADVVGYSRLMADDLPATTAVMDAYRRLVAAKVAEAGGTLVNFVGDNFMAVFEKAIDAMAAAIAISTEVEMRNAGLPSHRRVMFRMGIDRGEVTVAADGQYFGDPLNVAARLQSQAAPGGVNVSGAVYRALDEPELRFRPVGSRSLKNIPGTTQVYAFTDLPSEAAPAGRQVSLRFPTVAVLPIHLDTVDATLHTASAAFRADVTHQLAAIPGLRVIDVVEGSISERAENVAQYMLQSGVIQHGELLRVYAKLIDFATFNIVFSRRWEATPDSLFALSDQAAKELARSLEVELVIGEVARIYSEMGDAIAQQHIYQGWFQLTSLTPGGWRAALEHFEAAGRSHPDQILGPALLAFTHWIGAAEGLTDDPATHLRLAADYASVGVERGDPTGLSPMVEAAILLSNGAVEEAVGKMEAVEITRPTCDVTYGLEGSMRRYLGQWERSVESIDRAMALTEMQNPWYATIQACSLLIGEKFEDAVATAGAVLEYQPENIEALLVLAAAQHGLGLDRRARATADKIRTSFPSLDVDAWLSSKPYRDGADLGPWRRSLEALGLIAHPTPESVA